MTAAGASACAHLLRRARSSGHRKACARQHGQWGERVVPDHPAAVKSSSHPPTREGLASRHPTLMKQQRSAFAMNIDRILKTASVLSTDVRSIAIKSFDGNQAIRVSRQRAS
jgi:hypothetical protein